MAEMKYWHEISDKEFDRIHDPELKRKWSWVREHYKAPDWCEEGQLALDALGCWSLIDKELRKKVTKDFCKDCDMSKFYVEEKT
jgi:hypothetical protein